METHANACARLCLGVVRSIYPEGNPLPHADTAFERFLAEATPAHPSRPGT
jgi:hypothetical protein